MNFISLALLALFYNFCCLNNVAFSIRSKHLLKIDDNNWRDMLQGEWMINFYSKAAWCPACKEMERPWNAFADWSSLKKRKVKVAQINVSENPGLSGRFLVMALPTIYHVKDGVFRTYSGPKDKEDFVKFVRQKQWSTTEPLPHWKHPDSTLMSFLSKLFHFSMTAKEWHHHLVDDKGLPSLISFGLFGIVTLTVGCILGFFMVLIIDQFVPSGKKRKVQPSNQSAKSQKSANGQVKNGVTQPKSDSSKNGNVTNGTTANGHARQQKAENDKGPKTNGAATNGTTKSSKKKD